MLGFLIRRLFFALVVLLTVAVIDYGMFGDPLAPVLFHLDCGRACSHYLFGFGVLLLFEPSFGLLVLVEYVFFVPGFFGQTKRALGQIPELPPGFDIPMLQGLALWAAVLIVAVSALADVVTVMLDPRVREVNPARPRPVG